MGSRPIHVVWVRLILTILTTFGGSLADEQPVTCTCQPKGKDQSPGGGGYFFKFTLCTLFSFLYAIIQHTETIYYHPKSDVRMWLLPKLISHCYLCCTAVSLSLVTTYRHLHKNTHTCVHIAYLPST